MIVRVVFQDTQQSKVNDLVIENEEIEVHRLENGSIEICIGAQIRRPHRMIPEKGIQTWPRRIVVDAGCWIFYDIKQDDTGNEEPPRTTAQTKSCIDKNTHEPHPWLSLQRRRGEAGDYWCPGVPNDLT